MAARLSRWGRAASLADGPEDAYAFEQAAALHGLHFDMMDETRAARLAPVVLAATGVLRRELESTTDGGEVYYDELDEALGQLEGTLR